MMQGIAVPDLCVQGIGKLSRLHNHQPAQLQTIQRHTQDGVMRRASLRPIVDHHRQVITGTHPRDFGRAGGGAVRVSTDSNGKIADAGRADK